MSYGSPAMEASPTTDPRKSLRSIQLGIGEKYGLPLTTLEQLRIEIRDSVLKVKWALSNIHKGVDVHKNKKFLRKAYHIIGLSGVGKTDIFSEVCEELEVGLVVFHLGEMSEGELQGFAFPDREKGIVVRMPIDKLPTQQKIDSGELPEVGILLLDELTRASKQVQNNALQLVGTGYCGDTKLPDTWVIWACTNPDTGEYHVNKMDQAMLNRLVNFIVECEPYSWIKWAESVELNPLIISYIRANPDDLYDIMAYEKKQVFATPRTWERLAHNIDWIIESNKLAVNDNVDIDQLYGVLSSTSLVAGCVGKSIASRLFSHMNDYSIQFNIEQLIEEYEGAIRTRIQKACSGGMMLLLNRVNDLLQQHIHSNWPVIFTSNEKTYTSLSPQFRNIYWYWYDIALMSMDKAFQLYQGFCLTPQNFSQEMTDKQLQWNADFSVAVDLYETNLLERGEVDKAKFLNLSNRINAIISAQDSLGDRFADKPNTSLN